MSTEQRTLKAAHGGDGAKSSPAAAQAHSRRVAMPALALGALGVVFGDIGTSPLYAIDQIFFGAAGVAPTPANVLGAISLAIWTITVIVAFKYAALVLRAENEGEGGVFALYGLLHPFREQGYRPLLWALMLGAGLLFGDGMITPAISVVSAVEGLDVATPAFGPYVVPITSGAADAAVRHSVQGHEQDRRRVRAVAGRLVRRHRRAGPERDRARTCDTGCVQSRCSASRSCCAPGRAKR